MKPALAIQVITYQRSGPLDRTLAALKASALRRCAVTVLDNASNDETEAVCAAHARSWPELSILRHSRNLGVSANYLRAVELSQGEYTWVLGDDDVYQMEAAEELLQVVEQGEVDLVWCGPSFSSGRDPSDPEPEDFFDGRRRRLSELSQRLDAIHLAGCFLPNVAFRTSLFTPECFRRGSLNAIARYPHFPFWAEQVARDRLVQVLSRQLVRLSGRTVFPSQLTWRSWWLHSCSLIEDPAQRRRAVLEPQRGGRLALLRSLLGDLLQERAMRAETAADLFWRTWSLLPSGLRASALLLAPALLLPRPWCRRAAKRRLEHQGRFDDPLRL